MEKSIGMFMNSDMNTQSESGLLRFRSAPSSLLSNYTNGVDKSFDSCENFSNSPSSSSPEPQRINPVSQNGYSLNSSQLPPHYPRQSSSLMRQTSSPAGLFSHPTPQNGYPAMKGFSSRPLSRISEIDSESVGNDEGKFGNGNSDSHLYGQRYQYGSWNDSPNFAENFSGLKRELESDLKLFAGAQDGELGYRTPVLSHHLSLPNTSAEMAAMEKLLQFQDSVPCKIRAKRGFATHPRSIAERVRRTRISERMRKLQDLVPNMDKQTNTADMLDLAVEYIKDLQKQYKTLGEIRAKCKCSNMQKRVSNQTV